MCSQRQELQIISNKTETAFTLHKKKQNEFAFCCNKINQNPPFQLNIMIKNAGTSRLNQQKNNAKNKILK
jgi:hypothetical protein